MQKLGETTLLLHLDADLSIPSLKCALNLGLQSLRRPIHSDPSTRFPDTDFFPYRPLPCVLNLDSLSL